MPAPAAAALGDTAKQIFAAMGVRLPINWQEMGFFFPDAFRSEERRTLRTDAQSLFHEPTANRYHTGAARAMSRTMQRYIDRVCVAISEAVNRWMQMSSVVSVTINGPIGILLPGYETDNLTPDAEGLVQTDDVTGILLPDEIAERLPPDTKLGPVVPGGVISPKIEPFIMELAPTRTEWEYAYSHAIATSLSKRWDAWRHGLSAIIMYPELGAAPMPAAAPTPNKPLPVLQFASISEPDLAPDVLTADMLAALRTDGLHARALFESISRSFFTHFQVFKTATVVMNVMGTGPVLASSPGPVSNGIIIPQPGNFI